MIAGAGIFLMLLPLAAAPVVFHLLMRQKRRERVFSTPMFFHQIDPKMRARKRLQEILLLISRVLLIALALLALSRLSIHTVRDVLGFGERQMVVLVVDNSGSMNTKMADGKNTKLQTAKKSAQQLLSALDDDAKAAVLTLVDDPNLDMSSDVKGDKTRLAEAIGSISPTEATGKPATALQQAVSILKAASSTGAGSVHVFSDLQNTEWGEGNIDRVIDSEHVRIVFHRIPSAPVQANVSLVSAGLSNRRVLPKQPNTVFVELRNNGEDPVQVRLNSQDDQRKQTTHAITVPGEGRVTARVTIQPESKGNRWVRIWIEGDGYADDNQAVVAYVCGSTAKFFLVGADVSEFGRLPLALSPFGDGRFTSLVSEVISSGSLRQRIQQAQPALVAMSWTEAARISEGNSGQWLEQYVNAGGNLLILPPSRQAMDAVRLPSWIGAEVSALVEPVEQVRCTVLSESSDFWDNLRLPSGSVRLVGAFCRKYHPVLLPDDARTVPLLGTGRQEVLLGILKRGKGRIVCSGMAFSSKWTLLTNMPEFVPMAQSMALASGSREADDRLSLIAGEAPASLPGSADDIRVVSLVGDPMDWSGPRDRFPQFVRSGGYVMRVGEKTYGLSVQGAVEEGSGEFVTGQTVPLMGETEHFIVSMEDSDELKQSLAASHTGIELYLPLLLLAMLAMMAEGVLGTPRQFKLTQSATWKGEAAS